MQPKISIIIPVYNIEIYISKCIESIINQTYQNLEIIIINDGSTDKSGNLCADYAKKDNRIILIKKDNQGLSMARNDGLDIASGEYISFVDGDDWIDHDMIELLYINLYKYDTDISMCGFYSINQQGEYISDDSKNYFDKNYNLGNDSPIVLENYDKMFYYLSSGNIIAWNKLYKRYLFDGIRYPYKKIYEDGFTTHKLIDNAKKIVIIPERKYYYLCRNDSITKSHFTISQFDYVDSCIDRYNYIIIKYPELENICRKHIFIALLTCVYKAFLDNSIDIYKEDIEKNIKKVSIFNTNECGLSKNEETIIRLLFDNIKKYIVAMKFYNKRLLQ